jgi:hypothetical protein
MGDDGQGRPPACRSWRGRLIVAGGAVLAVVSFRPWWGVRVTYGGSFGPLAYQASASAWSASSLWSSAVLLGLIGAGLGAAYRPGSGWRSHACLLAAVALAPALWLAGWQIYRAADAASCHGPCRTVAIITRADAPPRPGLPPPATIRRDRLIFRHRLGYEAGLRRGFYLGLAALAVMLGAAASGLQLPGRPPPRG